MKIVIVNYGMGNIRSIINSLNFIGIENIIVSDTKADIINADRLILPGVGNYSTAIRKIRESNLDEYLNETVIIKKVPILGICLGMQLMGISGTEGGLNRGLGFVDGIVDEFDRSVAKVPHIGFNQVKPMFDSRLYKGIGSNPDFYFIHSYKMLSQSLIGQSLCEYSTDFVASFEIDNIAGVQFHPELSQTNGLKLLSNFIGNF